MSPGQPLGPARLVCRELDGPDDPLAATRWLRGQPRAVALSGAWSGGGTLLTSHPRLAARPDDDPFGLLEEMPSVSDVRPGCVGGGWFGWLGFGLAAQLEALPPAPPRPVSMPRFHLAFHDHLVRCDAEGRWWFEALWTQSRAEFLAERLAWWRDRLARRPPAAERFTVGPLAPVGAGLTGHRAAVAELVARIAAGELSQANLGLRLEAELAGDLLDLWLAACAEARPAYAALITSAGGRQAVASLSPELFLRRQGREVITRPVKGTAPAQSDPAGLAGSGKDRAENLMIVDLMRNDLGRVCAYGSIEVEELCRVGQGPGVWQLESAVRGRLRPEVGDGQLLAATFPPGSVTGAPKVQALKLIHRLEGTAREAYCGSIGLCSPLAGLELNVAIRTLELSGPRLWLGVGGGIVADSDPELEVQEALTKARGVLDAAGCQLGGDRPVRAAQDGSGDPVPRPAARPASPRWGRPDPAAGVFETIGVVAGRPVGLEGHLARLARSAAELGLPAPDRLRDAIVELARAIGAGGVRITLDHAGLRLRTRPPAPAGPMRLVPILVAGGLGAHKWADRSLIEAHSDDSATPLICDLDGAVLEAGYAGLLVVADGRLVVPPEDGRQLPSLSRDRLLQAAALRGISAQVRPIGLTELADAEAIILISSLRGPHPAELADGEPGAVGRWWLERLAEVWQGLVSADQGREPVSDRPAAD